MSRRTRVVEMARRGHWVLALALLLPALGILYSRQQYGLDYFLVQGSPVSVELLASSLLVPGLTLLVVPNSPLLQGAAFAAAAAGLVILVRLDGMSDRLGSLYGLTITAEYVVGTKVGHGFAWFAAYCPWFLLEYYPAILDALSKASSIAEVNELCLTLLFAFQALKEYQRFEKLIDLLGRPVVNRALNFSWIRRPTSVSAEGLPTAGSEADSDRGDVEGGGGDSDDDDDFKRGWGPSKADRAKRKAERAYNAAHSLGGQRMRFANPDLKQTLADLQARRANATVQVPPTEAAPVVGAQVLPSDYLDSGVPLPCCPPIRPSRNARPAETKELPAPSPAPAPDSGELVWEEFEWSKPAPPAPAPAPIIREMGPPTLVEPNARPADPHWNPALSHSPDEWASLKKEQEHKQEVELAKGKIDEASRYAYRIQDLDSLMAQAQQPANLQPQQEDDGVVYDLDD